MYIYISICQKLQIGFSCNRLRFYFFQQALLGTISTCGSILRQEQLSSAFKVQGIPSLDTWPRGKGQWWRLEEVEISFKVLAVGVIKWWKLLGGLTEKWMGFTGVRTLERPYKWSYFTLLGPTYNCERGAHFVEEATIIKVLAASC